MRNFACFFSHEWKDLPECPKGHLRQSCSRGCEGVDALRWLKDVDPRQNKFDWQPGLCECREEKPENKAYISGAVINHIANMVAQALHREGILVNNQEPPPAVVPALLALTCTLAKMRGMEHHHLTETLETMFYGGPPN